MVTYENMVQGRFLYRPNRFIAHVEIDGKEEICHVKNTGRCRELLPTGATVWCQKHDDPKRKTKFSLISVQKGKRCINMDSQVPNKVAGEYIASGGLGFVPRVLQPEKKYGTSRFDFYLEDDKGCPGYVEVKGVTLEKNHVAYFPDAPTERGARHLSELKQAKQEGFRAFVLFIVQMEDILRLEPNWETDPAFSQALTDAKAAGVEVLTVGCKITPETIKTAAPIEVRL